MPFVAIGVLLREDHHYPLLILEGDDSGNLALTKWLLGFNAHLVLGTPKVKEQQK